VTPERWEQIKKVLAAALEQESSERAAYLDQACPEPLLRRQVEALIAAHQEANGTLLDKLTEPTTWTGSAQSPGQLVLGRLGRYEIMSLLGRGGMGTVYLGLDTQLGRRVAIKVLGDETARHPAKRDRFLREARAAAALNHPGICAIHSIEEEKDILFLVLEYIEGQNFRALTIKPPPGWPPEPAVGAGYILQAAEALQAAHEAGIIHRDIKSSNLMRTVGDRVKVLDFGLAKVTGAARLTLDGSTLGTPAYASPEQIRGDRVDERSDLWSLGVVFYEVLTGQLPFSGDNMANLVHALLNAKPRPVRQLRPVVPAAIEHLIETLLSKSPDRRYASASALINELRPLALTPIRAGANAVSRAQDGMHALLGTAERRGITFLHIELVARTATEDPEDFQTALENSREICTKVVERHEGNMQAWSGNTGLALFGYPEARENAACLAVAAGLALAGAFGRGQLGFDIRTGIATALTVVDVRGVDAISSEGFELASVLANRAGTNEVLITEPTERQVEGRFALGREGELCVGQRWLPFRQVLHASSARSRFQLIPTALTPLAGRDRDLQLLLDQWQRTVGGQTHVTLIGGEPGLGKSRLVYELKQHVARNSAAAMAECFCAQQYANSALFPVVDCLERIWFETDVRVMPPDEKLRVIEGSLAELSFGLPETVPLFAQLLNVPAPNYPALEITSERQRSLTLQALVSMVIERASRQPFLFIVEDLQWADPTTLELLRMLVAQQPTVSLMALYTHRPEYVPQWSISGHVCSFSLDRLSRAESLAVTAAATRGPALDAGTMEQIIDNSDGVPLFLEEMTKAVVEYGAGASHGPKLPVPGNLRDSFIARLDRLGGARNVVRMASILGREFPQTLLAAISGLTEQGLEESLDRLVDAEVFYVRGSGQQRTYIFKHALLQNAAYDSLLKKARVALHRQVAELLVNRFPELASRQPEVVAWHFTEAGLGEKSIVYWNQAGMSALQRSAHVEAVSHFEQGLRVVRALPSSRSNSEQEILLLAGLGPALIATHGFGADQVGETFKRAEELLPRDSDSGLSLPTLWGVWVYNLVRSRLDKALATAVRMMDSGRRLNDGALLEGLWTAGNTLFWKGDLIASRQHLEGAEALYDPVRFGDHAYRFGQDSLVATLCYQSFVYGFLGLFERAIAVGTRAVEIARSLRHPFSIGWSLTFRATLDCFLGSFGEARQWGDQAVQYCQKQTYPFWISAALSASGKSMAEMGQLAEGIDRLRQGIAMTRAIGSRVIEPLYRGQLAEVLLLAGDGEAALAESEGAIRQASEQGVGISRLDLLRIRGLALSALGRRAEAEGALREALAESRAASCRYIELRAATNLQELTHDAAPLADVCADLPGGPGEPPVLSHARKILEAR
jgi:tetratricopeptide (TPR) repeat protein/class 3 adenylate cyclase/predicted Ser/Thr protein kinase